MSSLSTVRAANVAVNAANRRAVVIGGTAGIGKGIALRLAEAQCSVTIVGRNAEAGAAVVAAMRERAPAQQFSFIAADSSLVRSAKPFADAYRATLGDSALDFVVVTAGIATFQGYTPTIEGLDQKLAVHYFGRVAFIRELLPLMRTSTDARVLSVLSGGVHSAYEQHEHDFDLKQDYGLKKAADAAGFYNDIACDAMARETPNVSFIHAAPGFISSNWGTEMNWFVRGLVRALQVFGRSEADCGEFMTHGLFNAQYKAPGAFVMDQYGQRGATVGSAHEAARDSVWQKTLRVLDEARALAGQQ